MVIKGFSTNVSLDHYSEIGLSKAEEYYFKKYLKPGGEVLDIGCGAGRTSIPLAKHGYIVTGLDIVPKMIERARVNADRENVSINFAVGDAVDLGFDTDCFDDVIFPRNSIEYIQGKENRLKAMQEINRVMKEEGHFIFTTMNLLYFDGGKQWVKLLGQKVSRMFSEKEVGDYTYDHCTVGGIENFQHNCSPFEIKEQLKKAGFELIEHCPENWFIEGKKTNFLANFSKGRQYYITKKVGK